MHVLETTDIYISKNKSDLSPEEKNFIAYLEIIGVGEKNFQKERAKVKNSLKIFFLCPN